MIHKRYNRKTKKKLKQSQTCRAARNWLLALDYPTFLTQSPIGKASVVLNCQFCNTFENH